MRFLALLLLLPACASRVAVVDVSVIPMDAEGVLAHQTVIVRGDTIESVGPADRVRVPLGARRVDGRGRFLMPGLVDMHIHLRDPGELEAYLRYGVTTVVHASGGGGGGAGPSALSG